ncbi:hypothetical protein [Rubritalea tangerina]
MSYRARVGAVKFSTSLFDFWVRKWLLLGNADKLLHSVIRKKS